MNKKGKLTIGNFILLIIGLLIGTLNTLLRLKKLPNGMYNIEAYINSIMSWNFWVIMVIAVGICIIAIIWKEK